MFSQNVFSVLDSIRHQSNGNTILDGAVQSHHCQVESTQLAGDHYVIIAKITESTALDANLAPLYHHQRQYCGFELFKQVKKVPVSWQANLAISEAIKPVVVVTTRKVDTPLGNNLKKTVLIF